MIAKTRIMGMDGTEEVRAQAKQVIFVLGLHFPPVGVRFLS